MGQSIPPGTGLCHPLSTLTSVTNPEAVPFSNVQSTERFFLSRLGNWLTGL